MNLQEIKKEVERATGIDNISTQSRERNNVIARCMYCYLAYKNTASTYEKIGKAIDRHHATVLYSIESLQMHLRHEPVFKEIFESLNAHFLEKRSKAVQENQDREKMFTLLEKIPERKYKTVIRLLEAV